MEVTGLKATVAKVFFVFIIIYRILQCEPVNSTPISNGSKEGHDEPSTTLPQSSAEDDDEENNTGDSGVSSPGDSKKDGKLLASSMFFEKMFIKDFCTILIKLKNCPEFNIISFYILGTRVMKDCIE